MRKHTFEEFLTKLKLLYIFHKIAKLFSCLLSLPWHEDRVEVVLVKWFTRKVSKRRNTMLELPNQNARGTLRNKSVFFPVGQLNARCFSAKWLNSINLLIILFQRLIPGCINCISANVFQLSCFVLDSGWNKFCWGWAGTFGLLSHNGLLVEKCLLCTKFSFQITICRNICSWTPSVRRNPDRFVIYIY